MGETHVQNVRARQILDAARVCFGRHGFHGASMARIAGEAAISVGHIYRYFESKEAVVAAIAEEDLAEAAAALAAIEGEPEVMAARLLDSYLRSRSAAGSALQLEILSEAARNPKIAAIMREMDNKIRTYLRAAVTRSCGACAHVDAEALDVRIETVCALMEGANLRRFKNGGTLDPAFLRAMQEMLARTLATPLPTAEAQTPSRLNAITTA